ncbi:hypothetical protein M404DRAFT_1007700 [Pisolithus tinctorius Marx 270]|uniref:Uncharacterized protein n=1 Tax=Pisolithus tinctorius Marx 270 TaxID=870435 RepID=A0A0C3N2C4_PISTI|nr:hypothetical protein M404DRAFT_1007700 [Pisolithus tinctorius Marx 270]
MAHVFMAYPGKNTFESFSPCLSRNGRHNEYQAAYTNQRTPTIVTLPTLVVEAIAHLNTQTARSCAVPYGGGNG